MSKFSIPDGLLPTMKMLGDVTKSTKPMPAEFASTINLMAHPFAGAAAMSAIGVGMASHAMGFWFGTMSGAAAASWRTMLPLGDGGEDTHAFKAALHMPVANAEPAASTLIVAVSEVAEPLPAKIRRLVPRPPRAVTTDPLPVDIVVPATAESASTAMPVSRLAAEAVDRDAAAPEALTALAGDQATSSEVSTTAPVKPATASDDASAAPVISPASISKPAGIERPEIPDDLKAISGVGPKLEQVLNGLGVWTFGQIAGWGKAEIAWVDDTLGFKGRIDRDDWIGQASKLSRVDAAAKPVDVAEM